MEETAMKKLLMMMALMLSAFMLTANAETANSYTYGTFDANIDAEMEGRMYSEAEADTLQVNINTATTEELQKLMGVGSKRAQAIVNYRQENGAFATASDITMVKGIGPKLFHLNRSFILVE